MNFGQYLKSKLNVIIILFGINFFALFVNIFGIKGEFKSDTIHYYNVSNYFFTNGIEDNYKPEKHFWPIVNYTGQAGDGSWEGVDKKFLGIFNEYDYSEFLAYTLILFLIFYLVWNSKKNNK